MGLVTLVELKFLNSSFSSFFLLLEIRPCIIYRAVRASRISVSSVLPQSSRGAGVRPNSAEPPRGLSLAAAPHYRTRTKSQTKEPLPKAKTTSHSHGPSGYLCFSLFGFLGSRSSKRLPKANKKASQIRRPSACEASQGSHSFS